MLNALSKKNKLSCINSNNFNFMKNKFYRYENNELVYFVNFIKILSQNKSFILLSCIFFSLMGFILSTGQPGRYEVNFTINNPPAQHFDRFETILNLKNKNLSSININTEKESSKPIKFNNFFEEFVSDFEKNLISADNMIFFFENNQNYLNLKNSSEKINHDTYFRNFRISKFKEKNLVVQNKYTFLYSDYLSGDIFVNSYILFIKDKTISEFNSKIKILTTNLLEDLESNLEIAKIINLNDPILKSSGGYQVVNEPDLLFYRGTKVLTQQKKYLNEFLLEGFSKNFDYNPILEKASNAKNVKNSSVIFILIGFFTGLILSLMVILFKKKN
jgi:LPS O-antigen subunit length determinant protein (WzzB/FepE family)